MGMEWTQAIGEAVTYMEAHLTQALTVEEIAGQVFLSPFYFQRGFTLLCGFTVGDYLRRRRLTLAGSELLATQDKIIDIALKYGYDSPDSFTKAFTRFHGVTPTAVRKEGGLIKAFAPLKLKFTLEGGFSMEYKIVEKEAFTVLGVERAIGYQTAFQEIPAFWEEHCQSPLQSAVCGVFGVCLDEKRGPDAFTYLIADLYLPWKEIPQGCVTEIIPKHTWAVFPCKGPLPDALQAVNRQIFSQWLPNCREYEIAAGYNIEWYDSPIGFPKGTADENYTSEIWIPVKKK